MGGRFFGATRSVSCHLCCPMYHKMTLLEIALVSEPGPGKGLASRPALEDKPDGTVIVFTTLRQNCFKRSLLLFFNSLIFEPPRIASAKVTISTCLSIGGQFTDAI